MFEFGKNKTTAKVSDDAAERDKSLISLPKDCRVLEASEKVQTDDMAWTPTTQNFESVFANGMTWRAGSFICVIRKKEIAK